MRQGRYDDAIAALRAWHGPRDWTAYAEFNLGVALVRRGRLPEAIPHLDQVGRIATSNEELLALRDKANLALGFALLQAQRAADARPFLERVRLEGPYSSKALLGVGWADAALGEFKRALVPWLTLTKRNLLDSAVQESYLTVPYAYNQLGATGQAAESYNHAIDSFDAEAKLIDDSIGKIRSGNGLDWLLGDGKHETLTWYWQLETLPNAPESRYLYQLLASNEFQEGLKNYRELNFMSRNLDSWREDLLAYDDMLDTRQQAYSERLPKADAVLSSTDLDALVRKRVDFESRVNEIEQSNDFVALGTPEEQQNWGRLKRVDDFLAMHPDDPDLADMRDRLRLLEGVMYWRLSESFVEFQLMADREAGSGLPAGMGFLGGADQQRRLRGAGGRRPRSGGPIADAPGRVVRAAKSLPAGARHPRTRSPEAASGGLSSPGPLRTRGHLRQGIAGGAEGRSMRGSRAAAAASRRRTSREQRG